MIWLIVAVAVVWTVASVVYFCRNLGRKNGPDPWYAGVLLAPMFVIGAPFWFMSMCSEWFGRKRP